MTVGEVMLRVAFTCRETDPIDVCARIMRDEKLAFVPVVDAQDRVKGFVTDRDVALRVVAENRPTTTPVRDVMGPGPFVSARMEEEVRALEDRLSRQRKNRALVVNELGHCVGVVSLADLVRRAEPAHALEGR